MLRKYYKTTNKCINELQNYSFFTVKLKNAKMKSSVNEVINEISNLTLKSNISNDETTSNYTGRSRNKITCGLLIIYFRIMYLFFHSLCNFKIMNKSLMFLQLLIVN